ADRAIDFASTPKDGAQGLFWEGDTLYVCGDGGLRRFRDKDNDGKADGPSELIRTLRTGSEHGAHAIRRGPDGWLYVLCGNNTRIDKTYAQTPTSPVKDPVAGCLLRFSPDLKQSEIVCDGFRNPYDFDFNPDGEPFVYDSDNERCVSLPWYEPTRFYHAIEGGHHGWQSPQNGNFWRMPPHFVDVVAPLAHLGRGSPTGVVCYRHAQFPAKYRGGFFLADWTFGRLYFISLERQGSSYAAKQEVFLQSVGDNGFAPTDLVIHPETGDLYVSIGGRGTRGAVYRIRHTQGLKTLDKDAVKKLQPEARALEWHDGLGDKLIEVAMQADPFQQRRALASLCRHRIMVGDERCAGAVKACWEIDDRYVRQAAATLISQLGTEQRLELMKAVVSRGNDKARLTVALSFAPFPDTQRINAAGLVRRLLEDPKKPPAVRVSAVRLALLPRLIDPKLKGTVWEGYSASALKEATYTRWLEAVQPRLRAALPSGDPTLDYELARTMAIIEDDDPAALEKVAAKWTAESDPIDDLHYLICFARLKAARQPGQTKKVAAALLALDQKIEARKLSRDTFWPLRVGELYAELTKKDPQLNAALLNDPSFGRPDHALFARAAGFDQAQAAERFLARAKKDPGFAWSANLVAIVGTLPEEKCLPVLRELWGQVGLDEAILPVLARFPKEEDRGKFLAGLSFPQLDVVERSLHGLDKLPVNKQPEDLLQVIRSLRRLPEGKEGDRLRQRIGAYLEACTGQKLGGDKKAWAEWFTKTHPDLAPKLVGDGVNIAAWQKRLDVIKWDGGDARRGLATFTTTGCAACHSGAQALGPDLLGVTGRFSRQDLFIAILQPSRDISPRYRATFVETVNGKTYQGMVIYEATDSLILQTGQATTVRLAGSDIESRRFADLSLMPVGLLDKLSDAEIADLYAYLRSLHGPPK
ncbi:MAG: hypothetical protein AB7K24_32595, partial [Gemmataceae bacterium]